MWGDSGSVLGRRSSRLMGCSLGHTWDAEGRMVEGYDEPYEWEPDDDETECPECGREGDQV